MPIKYDDKGMIKRPNKNIQFTQEMVTHIQKAAMDAKYFAETFYHIINPMTGSQLIRLRPYQLKMIENLQLNRFNIFLASRQIGKTTVAAIYLLWYAIFHGEKAVAILANKQDIAKSILDEIKYAYERLPEWLKPGVVEYNAHNIKFDNQSEIICKATSPDALRGLSISLLFLDEFAFVAPNIADQFWAANYPTISTGGSVIVVSTPNGTGNLYYNLWRNANKPDNEEGKNSFQPTRIDWWEVEGRDDEWKKTTIQNIGKIRFAQEFGNQFFGSTATLIDADFLVSKLASKEAIHMPDDWTKYWKKKEDGRHYVISVDVSNGVGSDFSVANVFDVTDYPFKPAEQVCCYRRNDINVPEFTKIVYEMGNYWNGAYIIIETNANLGEEMVRTLFEEPYEYENLYYDYDRGEFGVYSTRGNKPVACAWFKELLESGKILVHDNQLEEELSYFEEVKEGVFKAKNSKNCFDDCVMTCIWLSYLLKSKFFEDMKELWQEYGNPDTMDENGITQEEKDSYDKWQSFLRQDYEETEEDWLFREVNGPKAQNNDDVWW